MMWRKLHIQTKCPNIRVQGLGKRNTEVQSGQLFRTRFEIRNDSLKVRNNGGFFICHCNMKFGHYTECLRVFVVRGGHLHVPHLGSLTRTCPFCNLQHTIIAGQAVTN